MPGCFPGGGMGSFGIDSDWYITIQQYINFKKQRQKLKKINYYRLVISEVIQRASC